MPFGEVLSTTGTSGNTLRFTGRERDPDTGLYYFRARYYDPAIGRFLSEDPLGFGGGDVNLYAYVGNNPLRFNDPTGNFAPLVTGAIGAGGDAIGTCFNACSLAEGVAAFVSGGIVGSGLGLIDRVEPFPPTGRADRILILGRSENPA